MPRQKTNKTARKRVKLTNPKGNRKAKLLYNKSGRNHLKTNKSSKTKRRSSGNFKVSSAVKSSLIKKIVNL